MSNDKWQQDYERQINKEINSLKQDPRGSVWSGDRLRELEQAKRDIKK